jgi:phospholipid/cholesterol/gamma-HCH transport system substrate-binding protein
VNRSTAFKIGLAVSLVVTLLAASLLVARSIGAHNRTQFVAYFANSNGIFVGDEVRVRGVPVGKIDAISPEPRRVRISFWVDDKYKVPADVKAVILSPTLVTARIIQLTPVYTRGPVLTAGSVIPQERTAVPVEWDDFREQLQRLTQTLQPTEPGGVSTLGAFVNTSADNLRGQGQAIRDAVIELSQAFSALGDHSSDIFSTVKNLSVLASALRDSSDVLRDLNQNLAAVTGSLVRDPASIGQAVRDINDVAGGVKDFVADNREALGTSIDKLASISQALQDSRDDIKQALHVAPNAFANFINIYEPAQSALTGILAANNFANPITFLCGAVQAASRLGAEQSAKLCAQYLAPIVKNRQYNFPPIGLNPFVGASARPNELTYSEDWLRPDYVPPQPAAAAATGPGGGPPLAAEAPNSGASPIPPEPISTDPGAGLSGMMVPPGGGQ